MNDLAENEKPAILENLARGIGEIDRALDAVTKAELLRQPHGHVANREDAAGAADLVHDVAAIMRLDLLLHRRHHFRRAQVHFLARGRAAGDKISAHGAGRPDTYTDFQRAATPPEVAYFGIRISLPAAVLEDL